MKLSALKTDLAKAKEGIWIGDIPDFGNVRLKVRPISNPDYRKLYGQLVDSTPRNLKRGGQIVDYDAKMNINARCLAEAVLLDWEGFEDDDGKPIKYTPERAKEMLLDPALGALRDAVAWAANVAEEESRASAEEQAGN